METVLAMSSNINYADKTIYPNLERFKNLPFKVDIYISGHDKYSLLNSYNNINIYSTDYNVFDFTAIVSKYKYEGINSHIFLLHDTVGLGDNFSTLLKEKLNESSYLDAIALQKGPSRGMGWFNYKYLLNHKNLPLLFGNTSNDIKQLNHFKKLAIQKENLLFDLAEKKTYFQDYDPQILEEASMQNSFRRTYYFDSLDLYKYQANYTGIQPSYRIQV
jgi:hypothetical protein